MLSSFTLFLSLILLADVAISVIFEMGAQFYFDRYHSSHTRKNLFLGAILRIARILCTWIACALIMRIVLERLLDKIP